MMSKVNDFVIESCQQRLTQWKAKASTMLGELVEKGGKLSISFQ